MSSTLNLKTIFKMEAQRTTIHIKANRKVRMLDNRPEKVEGQLQRIGKQGVHSFIGVDISLQPYAGAADSHKNIKNCPHDRKKECGRGKGRFVDYGVKIQIVSYEKSAKTSDSECNRYRNDVWFKFSPHKKPRI